MSFCRKFASELEVMDLKHFESSAKRATFESW